MGDHRHFSTLTDVYGDALFDLLEMPEVKRLEGVGFLGTVARVFGAVDTNRLDHSINVARLAFITADRLGFREQDRDAIVLYYLLHDIGHLPHSHVTEPLLRLSGSRFRFHDSLGRSRIRSTQRIRDWCCGHLPNGSHVWSSLLQLLNGDHDSGSNLGLLASLRINCDRLEGIFRAATTVGLNCPAPAEVLSGLYVRSGLMYYAADHIPLAAAFWEAQAEIYREYVFNVRNQSAEALLKKSFLLALGSGAITSEFAELTDAEAWDQILKDKSAAELMGIWDDGLYLTRLWQLPENLRWLSQTFQIGSRICSSLADMAEMEEYVLRLCHWPEHQRNWIALHWTRWREFSVNESAVDQLLLFDPPAADLTKFLVSRQTPTMIPVGLFSPPLVAGSASNNEFDVTTSELDGIHELMRSYIVREDDIGDSVGA